LGFTKSRPRGRPKCFSHETELAIVQEGEEKGVKAVCAKYGVGYQTYRDWRFKARGIRPRKRFSLGEKLQILEEGYQNGIPAVCGKYQIETTTYHRWKHKLGFNKSPKRVFSEKERLLIVNDAVEDGICKACRKHKVSEARVHDWAQAFGLEILHHRSRFSPQQKLQILEEGYQNGISRTCTAYGIDLTVYYYWKSKFKFEKSPRRVFTEEERRQIVDDAIRDGITRVSKKHQLWRGRIRGWARAFGLEIPTKRRGRFSAQQKLAIVQEGIRNGSGVVYKA
jgi:transposase-like protein